jgi:hypothetical protein
MEMPPWPNGYDEYAGCSSLDHQMWGFSIVLSTNWLKTNLFCTSKYICTSNLVTEKLDAPNFKTVPY